MPGLNGAGQAHAGDDGSADPAVAAALAAYAAGQGGDHEVLTALAASRLLVPLIALGDEGRQRAAEMAIPSVVGADGRLALLAFTCLDAMTRWRAGARPVPVAASRVWQAARQEASAAVIDLAGPVPLAVEGARLAALAAGEPPPPPHADPDVRALAQRALAGEERVIAGFGLLPGGGDSDVVLTVWPAPGQEAAGPAVRQAIERAVTGILAGSGGRFRRGIAVAVTPAESPR